MSNRKKIIRSIIPILLILFTTSFSYAQLFKKLQEKAQETAEKALERKTEEKTEEAIDEVLEGKKNKKSENDSGEADAEEVSDETPTQVSTNTSSDSPEIVSTSGSNIVTGSSFYADGTVIFEDDFSLDVLGDFPAKWNTDLGGEVITVNDQKALKLYPNGVYLPDVGPLPQNYALDFDFTTANLKDKELAGSSFNVFLTDGKYLSSRHNGSGAEFDFSLWAESSIVNKIEVENWGTEDLRINKNLKYNVRSKLNRTTHFTVVVNNKRMRLYIDNEKVMDIPSLLQNNAGRYIQFYLRGTTTDENHIVAIHNVKIFEEGLDVRAMLLKGGFSTTKILFESGSDQLKPESSAFLNQVGAAMESEESLQVMVIGHTDSDGEEDFNKDLSARRAQTVKNYLQSHYKISSDRLMSMGKGESDPVADNDTEDGKAQNRRVEFKTL